MKKTGLSILIAVCLLLMLFIYSSCGAQNDAAVPVNFEELYTQMTAYEDMPGMIRVPNERGLIYFGIDPEDCNQEIAAICEDSLRADELWLVEAKNAEAAQRIGELAKQRIEQKSEETKNYLPEQYKIVQSARLIQNGNYIVLIISPVAEKLAEIVPNGK